MDYIGPTSGSPLIPPALISGYLILLVLLLFICLKVKHIVLLTISFHICLFVVLGLMAMYILIPIPTITHSVPEEEQKISPSSDVIEIVFDRPVNRKILQKSIEPNIPGVWVFEHPLYATHLYRKLVFHPLFTFQPGTTYTVTISQLSNFLQVARPVSYSVSFATQESPKVSRVVSLLKDVNRPDGARINVFLDRPNDSISQFDFALVPFHPLEARLDSSKSFYTLLPASPLVHGTRYQLQIKKTGLTVNRTNQIVVARGPTIDVYSTMLGNPSVLGLQSFHPSEGLARIDTPLTMVFDEPMEKLSVEQNIRIEPSTPGTFSWKDERTLMFTPQKWNYSTKYTFTVARHAKTSKGTLLAEDIVRSFQTFGNVALVSSFPSHGWSGVGVDEAIRVRFNQEVEKASAESRFSINPSVSGSFRWEQDTLVFQPTQALSFNTRYIVRIAPGVKSIYGLDAVVDYNVSFTTQESIIKLAVPQYLQQYALSCEVATLRMVLSYRGVAVSEKELLTKVGVDPTAKRGNIWGNPYVGFVGNVHGKQMVHGYGVYWEPIARAANAYRYAVSFTGWDITKLTESILQNHPVIIWVYIKNGQPTYWFTPGGDRIYAVPDEHTVVVVGFVGAAKNPSHLIVNDPLVGQTYWSRDMFDKKWAVFGQSGVVVY